MLNNILIAAAVTIPVTPFCSPVLAENIISPKPVPAMFAGLGDGDRAPAIALHEKVVPNNIACRNAARSKFFELGARSMSPSEENAQFGIVGSMNSVVWCRGNRAIISVAGPNYSSVSELRDELARAF